MENNFIKKSNRGKTVLLDSDFRAGAILYSFTATLLLAYSIVNTVMWQDVRLKPTQSVTYNGATALFVISIIIAIFAGGAFIYSIYKIIVTSEQRDKIAKSFYAWASQPTGIIPSSKKIELSDLNKIPIQQEPLGRDIFATSQIKQKDTGESNFQSFDNELDLGGF